LSDSQPADNYSFFCGIENANHHLGTGFFILQGIGTAVKRAKFISVRMLYINNTRRSLVWYCFNVHAPAGDKSDDMKDSFYSELEHVVINSWSTTWKFS